MPEAGKFYTYRGNPDYGMYVHASFYSNETGKPHVAYEDYDGFFFVDEVIDFDEMWEALDV